MKKAVFLFSVAVISTKVWGTQNVFVTPPVIPQSNVNREVIQSTQISYTTRPVENSVTETQITNDLNDRAHARRLNNHILTGINEGSTSIRSRSYTTQNRVPTLGRRNDQNFMRHRMWNRPYTPQNAIIPLSVPRNCYVSRGNNIIRLFTRRTYVSFYDTVYIETSEFQSTPQQAVTYPYNIPYASGRWPHSQLQPPFDASRDLANQDDDDLQGG